MLFAVVRREDRSCADLAVDWEARQRVAKEHVWRRGRRAIEVAERKAAGALVAGLMAGVGECLGITSERNEARECAVVEESFRPRFRLRKTEKRVG